MECSPNLKTNSDGSIPIFILVHGTIIRILGWRVFGKRSWTDDDAPFRKQLARDFPDVDVEIPCWTGDNSHQARLDAGADLGKWLSATVDPGKTRKYAIVAHSHGGNVVLYALRHLTKEQLRHVHCLICVGTPFICASVRNLSESLGVLWTSTVGSAAISVSLLVWGASAGPAIHFAVPSFVLAIALLGAIRLRRPRRLGDLAFRYRAEIHSLLPEWVPVYGIRAGREEALAVLDFMSFAVDLLFNLWHRSVTMLERFSSNVRNLIAGSLDWVRDRFGGEISIRRDLQSTVRNDLRFIKSISPFRPHLTLLPRMLCLVTCVFVGIKYLWIAFVLPFGLLLCVGWLLGGLIAIVVILSPPSGLFVIVFAIAVILPPLIAASSIITRAAPWGFGEHWLLPWLVEVEAREWPQNQAGLETMVAKGLPFRASSTSRS
jgi:hypothetical protein